MSVFQRGQLRRWPNGGGLVQDWCEVARTVVVEEDSIISRAAEVRDDVKLRHSSTITGNGKAFGKIDLSHSLINRDALVAGNVQMVDSSADDAAQVLGTPRVRLVESFVYGRGIVAGDIRLTRTTVCDDARVYDQVEAEGVVIKDRAIVTGTARLNGKFTIDQAMRIHEGLWTRPPKYVADPLVQMTECINGRILIGCQCRELSWWRENAYAMGRKYGWKEEDVARFLELSKTFD